MTSKNYTQVTITAGQSVSGMMSVPDPCRIAAIAIPSTWIAADLGFNVSVDGVNFQPLYQSTGAIYSVKAAASKTTALPAFDFGTYPYVQFTSLTVGAATSVNQTSNAPLTIYFDDLS